MDTSALVARQYTEYAYPAPIPDIAEWRESGKFIACDPSLFPTLLWPEGRPQRNPTKGPPQRRPRRSD